MNVKTYDDSDLIKIDPPRGDDYLYAFVQDLPGDNANIFNEHDNLSLGERLLEAGVIGKDDLAELETCIFYIYFKDLQLGRAFIQRLNKYINKKAELIQKALAF
jgi:hypothetical protein